MGSSVHQQSLQECFHTLLSSAKGISDFEAKRRIERDGLNKFSEPARSPMWMRLFGQFNNLFSYLLIIGSFLSFIGESVAPGQGSIYIAVALLLVTLLNAGFTFAQEYKAEKAMDAFRNLLPPQITVIRNGVQKRVDAQYIAKGDVLFLQEGDKIPADARVIEQHLLKVDHSALTGESEPQLRTTHSTHDEVLKTRNMVFSGTLVQSGTGYVIVTQTGDATAMGQIAKMTQDVKPEQSKIQKELQHFVRVISSIAIVLGVVFFGLGFIAGNSALQNLIFAIGIIVANVPEGLLPTVTLTLALAAKRMAKNKALVRDMEAIETLGAITTICTDKTGTLTQNKITVEKIFMGEKTYSLKGNMLQDEEGKTYSPGKIPDFERLLQVMTLCNNAHHVQAEHRTIGDPTEVALIEFAEHFEDVSNVRVHCPRKEEIPFDSDKKYMLTANTIGRASFIFLKGAPEKVLAKCTHIAQGGKVVKLTAAQRKRLLEKDHEFASNGMRILGFGYKKGPVDAIETDGFVFMGMTIMSDPPRPEVKRAVRLCKQAGITIIVISGDQPETVSAIARQVGIAKNPELITGEQLARMSDSELKHVLKKEVIFARALPMDKLRVVHVLQQMEKVVAVTGDGVNDAPALKKADVGVAMGSGTEVAKEASDVVLLDDNFATIERAVREGRTIYDNIKSFVIYILTSNTPEIVPFLVFVLLDWPLALPALLILAIDLGTDMLPAISLGVERPEPDIMQRKPRSVRATLVNWRVIARSYGFIGAFQTLFAYIVFFKVLFAGNWSFGSPLLITDPLYMSAVSAFFATIVITQVFNLIACRTLRTSTFAKPFKNKTMLLGIAVELALLAAIVTLPLFNTLFSTMTFPLHLLPIMVGGGIVLLGLEELRKWAYRRWGWFNVS